MKKAFLITSTWIIVLTFFTLFLMLATIFYTGFNMYQLSKLTLQYPDYYEDDLLFNAIQHCFSYYDPYTFDTYSYLTDPSKVNVGNLTNCIKNPLNISVRINSDRFDKKITTPKWEQDDTIKDFPVIFIDNYEKFPGTMSIGLQK